MKRVAVLGGTGMAGHVAVAYLSEIGYDVFYTSRSAPESERSKPLDASDVCSLRAWLDTLNPDIVVNCVGLLVGDCDARPDKAIKLNAYLPRILEHKLINTRVKIIHLSTDCVFSGKRGGYLESDAPDGETVYDRAKALGEIANNKDLTFRMSIIGPDCDENGIGLFNWFMKQKGTIRGYTKAMWNGVTTIELARAIDCAILQDLKGLYHLTPDEAICKHDLLLLFKDVFGRTDIEIEPYDGYVVDKTLKNTRTDFCFEIRDYPTQVRDMLEWVKRHKDMYSYYSRLF